MISNIIQIDDPLFSLGTLVKTQGADKNIPHLELVEAVQRHSSGDWGEVCEEDQLANDLALENGGRLLSVFETEIKIRFYVITEADRSATTVLLPSEY